MDDDRKNISYEVIDNKNDENFKNFVAVPKIGHRHFQVLIYFCLLTIAFLIKSSMSVGIVVMMDPKLNNNPNIPTYPHWTNKNIILSSFFWSYSALLPFSGVIVHKYGPKWILVGGLASCSVLHAIIPQVAEWLGSTGVMVVRIIQGATESFFYPAVHTLLSQWVPTAERSGLGAFTYNGLNVGIVLTLWVTGPLAETQYGWPLVFYFFGGTGVVLSLVVALLAYASPADHPYISDSEKLFIESDLGHLDGKLHPKTPWKAIWTSPPFWAILFCQMGDLFGFWGLANQIPSYMNYVMNFNVKKHSFLLALPYIIQMIATPVFGFISDCIISKKYVSVGTARKIFNSIGLLGPAVGLIVLSTIKFTHPLHVMILLTVVTGINSGTNCGWLVNHMDLSPNHSGTLMGLTSGIANIAGFMAPLTVNFLVKDDTDATQWNRVFLLTASFYIVATLIYDVFGSGERQSWNEDNDNVIETGDGLKNIKTINETKTPMEQKNC